MAQRISFASAAIAFHLMGFQIRRPGAVSKAGGVTSTQRMARDETNARVDLELQTGAGVTGHFALPIL